MIEGSKNELILEPKLNVLWKKNGIRMKKFPKVISEQH
jgi:hypothetical protein